jgi:hypothetical protein
MRTAWTLTIFGLLLLAMSLIVVGIVGSDNKALNPGLIALVAVAGGALLLLLWFVPKLQVRRLGQANSTEHFSAENEARKSLAQIFGGIAFLATFYVSWANYNIEADKEVTETFGKAVEQLSNSDVGELIFSNGSPSRRRKIMTLSSRFSRTPYRMNRRRGERLSLSLPLAHPRDICLKPPAT